MESGTKPKRFRFTIRLLLLATAVACFVLSLYFPRVYRVIEIDCGATNGTEAIRQCRVAKSHFILSKVIEGQPDLVQEANGDAIAWLRDRIETTPTDKNFVRIRVVGKPTERKEIDRIANAVANAHMENVTRRDGEILDLLKHASQLDLFDPRQKAIGEALYERMQEIGLTGAQEPDLKIISSSAGWGR